MRRALIVALAAALLAPAAAGAEVDARHRIELGQTTQRTGLPGFETTSYSLTCPAGRIATDGMWLVDQPPGLPAPGVSVLAAYPSADDTYTFRIRNVTAIHARLKLAVTCLGATTEPGLHEHELRVTPQARAVFPYPGNAQGTYRGLAVEACPAGSYRIAPGFRVESGDAEVFASMPHTNLRGWSFGVYVRAPGTSVAVYGSCLRRRTAEAYGHRHELYAFPATETAPLDLGGGVWEREVACGRRQRALAGGFDVFGEGFTWDRHAWWSLGMAPHRRDRTLRTLGTGPLGQAALVCLNVSTGG